MSNPQKLLDNVATRQTKIAKLLAKGEASPVAETIRRLAWVRDKDVGTLGYLDPGGTLLAANETDMSARFVVSTVNEDRDGDIVLPRGCRLDSYRNNPVWFWGHQESTQHPFPIGTSLDPRTKALAITLADDRVEATCFYDQGDPDAVFIFGKVARGFLRAVSIAFLPWEAEKRENPRTRGDIILPSGYFYKSWELTEISHVGVGANAEAIRMSLEKDPEARHISRRLRKSLETVAEQPMIWSPGWTQIVRKQKMAKSKKAVDEALNTQDVPAPEEQDEDRVALALKNVQECVSGKMPKLMDEGYDRDQALAIAFKMCGEGKELNPEDMEETAKALGIVKVDPELHHPARLMLTKSPENKKAQNEADDYDPDKNLPENAEEKPEQEQEEPKPFGAQVLRDLVQHFADCHNYLQKVGPQVEHPEVAKLVADLTEEIGNKVAGLKEQASNLYQMKFDEEDVEKDDGERDDADETETGLDEKEDELDPEEEEILDRYRNGKENGKGAKGKRTKRLSKKSVSVIREAGEYMEDLAGDEQMPKRHKGGLRYHAAQLLGLGKEDEPEPEQEQVEEKGLSPRLLGEWSEIKKQLFELTGQQPI